ncbi:MAG: hypothetical protein ACOYL5_15180 [Phototrophicaceae bacterium]
MQHLSQLSRLVDAAAVINDLTRRKQTYTLPAMGTITFYAHTEATALRVVRWSKPQVEITLEVRPPLAWRVATDYDENGVYLVVVKRLDVGRFARATAVIFLPEDTHLMLRMKQGLLTLDHINGTLEISPPTPLEVTPQLSAPAAPSLPANPARPLTYHKIG